MLNIIGLYYLIGILLTLLACWNDMADMINKDVTKLSVCIITLLVGGIIFPIYLIKGIIETSKKQSKKKESK